MKENLKKSIFIILTMIIIFPAIFGGCIEEVEKNKFTFKSWKTMGYEDSKTLIYIEFETSIKEGVINLYSPSDSLVASQGINEEIKNISFIISNYKSSKPELGKYEIIVKEKELNEEKTVMAKILCIQDSNISITDCKPIWEYNEGKNYFELKTVNITLKNSGGVYGFIYEGRIIVDNSSIFLAPDYHWHDLNLWFMPGQEISLDLPVEVPWLLHGSHFIKIYMQDDSLNTVALYELTINTP